MNKRTSGYYRNYYARTIERRRRLARERKVRRYWTHWLLAELHDIWHQPQGLKSADE